MLGIRTRGARPSDLARELIAIPAIDYVILTTGRYQLWVELFCKDLAELREMVEVTVHGLAGVEEVEIFPYLRLRYQADAFQHRENQVLGRGIGAQIPVDQIDRDIVAELSPDGRLALQRVANRLGISEAQVRRRLHRLQSAGAARVMAMTNPFSLGFEAIAKLGVRVAPGHSVAGVADALVDIEEVSYVALCTGRFDILSEVICLDVEALNAALDGRLRQIPGLARVEAFLYLGLHMKSVGVAATTPRGGADAVVSLEPLSS
jgi:Lrp/AsnC family transcriptional regulator for asnA, asnC and gidA